MQECLNFLQQRGGADLLNEGQVTTLSGRQAQFQVVDVPDDAMQKSRRRAIRKRSGCREPLRHHSLCLAQGDCGQFRQSR